ncbi:MAG: hypothetical protein KIS87_09675 [Phycisphaeraceae bacterium]|nr:hypothetical protein [Phycisphaeraceae bacterium]
MVVFPVSAAHPEAGQASSVFMFDDARTPRLVVEWTTVMGEKTRLEADLPYAVPEDRLPIGHNLGVFVAAGGVRLEKGVGHPEGLILRMGLVKQDDKRPMFEGVAHNSEIVLELQNVAFTSPGVPRVESVIQRLQYRLDDVLACGLPSDQADMYNLASLTDDLAGAIPRSRGRFGALNGAQGALGRVEFASQPDGSITFRVRFAYRALRHQGDPWRLELPGTFFEPSQFHFEFEAVPVEVASLQFGLKPL